MLVVLDPCYLRPGAEVLVTQAVLEVFEVCPAKKITRRKTFNAVGRAVARARLLVLT
jgi:hypothetical protein